MKGLGKGIGGQADGRRKEGREEEGELQKRGRRRTYIVVRYREVERGELGSEVALECLAGGF
jgi:hypothetical protein